MMWEMFIVLDMLMEGERELESKSKRERGVWMIACWLV
jgi:hypothetical protein